MTTKKLFIFVRTASLILLIFTFTVDVQGAVADKKNRSLTSSDNILEPLQVPVGSSSIMLDDVTFEWSTKYNNSIRAYLHPANSWTWATSEILAPDPRQLGAWKWSAPYNWTRAYVVTNIEGRYETYKICTGQSSSDPGDPSQLYNDPRNRCYKVWRTGTSSISWVKVFNVYGKVSHSIWRPSSPPLPPSLWRVIG